MHRYQPRNRKKTLDEKFIFQIALPQKLRLKVMQDFHDNNGHFGFKKTYAAIQAKYYWPKMFQEIPTLLSHVTGAREQSKRLIQTQPL